MQPTANLWETLCADLQSRRTNAAERDEYVRVAKEFANAARGMLRATSPRLADAWEIAGDICRESGGEKDARDFYQEALRLSESLAVHAQAARIAAKLAEMFDETGEEEQAIAFCDTALHHLEQNDDHSQHPYLLSLKAKRLKQLRRHNEAEHQYREAIAVVEKLHGADCADLAVLHNNLGIVHMEQGNYASAEKEMMHALELRERIYGATHPEVAHSLANLGVLNHCRGDYATAARFYRGALDIYRRFFPPNSPEIQNLQENLSAIERY